MSKSYNNGILLSETMDEISPKVREMLTDKARLRRRDPGNPENCNLFPYHELLTDQQTRDEIRAGCLSAGIGCVDCKAILLRGLRDFLEPMHERRALLDAKPGFVREVLEAGNKKAGAEAQKTMEGVRELIGF